MLPQMSSIFSLEGQWSWGLLMVVSSAGQLHTLCGSILAAGSGNVVGWFLGWGRMEQSELDIVWTLGVVGGDVCGEGTG